MPKRVAEVGEGNEEGSGVYGIVRDLIVEGKDARFVNKKGRFVVNWSRALDCFTDYKAKKNPQFKSKKICRRKASNGFRAALLNHYKKEGAKEFKESKKVNEKDEVVERQFQMPPRLFESLFRDVKITEDSEDDEQDTSSIASEVDIKAEVSSSSSASDTGFDEFMDLSLIDLSGNTEPSNFSFSGDLPTYPCLDAINTEEDNCLSDSAIPPPSQMFETSVLDSALEEICSDGISDEISDEGMDLLGVVQDICPTSGSVKGGFQFYVSLTEELPDDVKSGVAHFQGVAPVRVQKLNPYTLSGIVPPSEVPGEVPVSITTDAGQQLGMTCFRYVDEMREVVRQLVKDPTLQSLWFAIWSQEHGFFGTDTNISQVLGPLNMQDQDSSVQTKQQQSVKVLQLLVYTAAQTDAQQFLEMIFSTSAGQIVFNSYKDRTPLPEDIARANGHEDLAQFLQDINTRLSKETSIDVQSNVIDWLELVKAVQNQTSISQDKSSKRLKHPCENEDNSSDYFADAETSSCGSFDHDTGWSDISEDKGPCTKDIVFNQVPTKRPAISEQASSGEIPVKVSDNKKDKKSAASWGFTRVSEWLRSKWRKREDISSVKQDACLDKKDQMESSTFQRLPGVTYLSGLFGKADASTEANVHGTSKPNTAKPKEYGQRNHGRSSRRSEAALKYKGIILTLALVTVLAGFKLSEGQILHWAVGNGYTRFSSILLQCGVYVDAPGLLRETPLHLAARNGFKDLVDVLIQSGGNVNSRNFPMQETPLHLATQNGHQRIAEFLIQRGSHVNARNFPMQETPLHLATRHGDQRIAEFLIQHGSQVNASNVPWQDTPLHLAAENGRKLVAEVLIQHGGDLNARNNKEQVPLHLAAQNGHEHVAEVLIQHGSDVNAKSVPLEDTPLHLAAENGHRHVAEVLLQHGSDVSARNNRRLMLNQLDVMTQLEMFLQHGFDTTVYIQNTPLHLAAENGHRQVAEVLISHGSKVNAKNNLGHAPLHLAAQHGRKCVAEVLIKHGSDVNSGWQTPLHLAALNGHKDITEVLLKHGSDVNARSVQSQHTPLHFAAEKGQKQVAELLIQHGSNITARDSLRHFTPLHLAAQNGHGQVAEVFIQHGGDVNARSRQENTPLHIASASGHKDIADLLIQHRSDVNASHVPWKSTPLHMAVENGHKEIAELLIQRGSDVSAKNKHESTPIYVAARDDQKHIVDVFIQHGNDAPHIAFEYGCKQISKVLNQHAGGSTSQDGAKESAFDLASESELQLLPEVLMHRGILEELKSQSQQVNLTDPVTRNLLIDVSSIACLGSINRKRLKLGQSHSERRNTVHSLFTEELLNHNTDEKKEFYYSQSNDHDKASVSFFTKNSAQDSINIEVLMDNELVSSYNHQHHVKTLLLAGIVVMCLVIIIIMVWYKYQLGVPYRKKEGKKEEDYQCNENNFQCTVTQNRCIQASMIELRMERVRSWLACDLGQEEPPSVDIEGNTDEILNTGNHEANKEPDLQNQEPGHPAALSFNKGNMARADQHQDFNVPGSLTDNIDDNGSTTASPETGQVEVSDECSSSSEEEFTTSGISEGDFVLTEGNTDEILNTGNHEANGEPDLQIQEQGHPAALSFNKVNMARTDQHQDSHIPGSLTDKRDDDGSTTASHETGQVEVSDECSSSSEEKFTTSGISEGDFVLIEEDTSWLLRTRLSTTAPYFTGCQKQSRGTPVPGLLMQELKQSETDPTKYLSLVKQFAVNDSCLDCIDCFVRDYSPVDEHLNKLEDGVQQSQVLDGFNVTLFNIPWIADIHNLRSLDQPVIHKDIKGKNVLPHVIDEDTIYIHPTVYIISLCGLYCIELDSTESALQKQIRTHRYLAEAFARDCLEILKCSATLSLQKEAYQRLHLLIRKYCRGNSQARDLEREPTEQRAVGQPSDEVNHAIVPRRLTEEQNPQRPSHNGLMEPNAAGASPIQANEAFCCQQPEDDHTRQLEDREMPLADVLQAVVAPRYSNRPMEIMMLVLSVRPMQEVPLYRLQSRDTQTTHLACYPQPHNGQNSGRLWSLEGTSPLANQKERRRGLANGVSYSIQETKHSQEQARAVEHVYTNFSLEQQTLNRLSPPEAMLTAGKNCDGKYKWTIKNFSQHLQDAFDGKIASVESPAIHKGLFGYKFFVRIFPNGINSRDGRHVSLFIGMMQEEHDHALVWPFSGKISLTILDQSDAEFRNHISGTFVAKRNLRTFQKPAATQNPTLYGYAEFAPIQLVCSPQYSRDDTVIVKIEIDIIR